MPDGLQLSVMMGPILPRPVPRAVVDAITGIEITAAAGAKSGFQITLAVSKASPILQTLLPQGFFDPPARVTITLTLKGTPTVLMDGVITRHELAPSNEPGQARFTCTGEDVSRMMDVIDFSGFPFPAMPPEARVAAMVGKYAPYGLIPNIVPSVMMEVPNPLDEIPTQDGTDLAYITALAEIVGYEFYVEPGPVAGTNIAYWGPAIKTGPPQPALTVNGDASSNVESLSFSFDGFAKTQFVVLVQEPNSKMTIPVPVPDVNPLQPPLGRRSPLPLKVEPLRGLAKFTPLQAAGIALAKAARSADVISGQGTLDVLRYGRILKSRRLVGVRGAGPAHDGLYYVSSVTHSIKRGEYKQSFSLSRNATVPFSQELPV